MDWAELHRAIAERGWTLTQTAAHFMGGISGTKLSLSGFDADEEPEPIEAIVLIEDCRDPTRDAILEAAIMLCQTLDHGFI